MVAKSTLFIPCTGIYTVLVQYRKVTWYALPVKYIRTRYLYSTGTRTRSYVTAEMQKHPRALARPRVLL